MLVQDSRCSDGRERPAGAFPQLEGAGGFFGGRAERPRERPDLSAVYLLRSLPKYSDVPGYSQVVREVRPEGWECLAPLAEGGETDLGGGGNSQRGKTKHTIPGV